MKDHYSWFPVLGEFNVQSNQIEFIGKLVQVPAAEAAGAVSGAPAGSAKVPALGTILSDQYFSSGSISASVTFTEVGPQSGCEIIIGYDVERRGFIAAGIPGFEFAAFSIREWQPGALGSQVPAEQPHWLPMSLGGDRTFIASGRAYNLEVAVLGSRISLSWSCPDSVDG